MLVPDVVFDQVSSLLVTIVGDAIGYLLVLRVYFVLSTLARIFLFAFALFAQ